MYPFVSISYYHFVSRLYHSIPFCIILYTITWLLCAFSLVVDRDLLKDTDDVKSTRKWRQINLYAVTSSVIYYSTHTENFIYLFNITQSLYYIILAVVSVYIFIGSVYTSHFISVFLHVFLYLWISLLFAVILYLCLCMYLCLCWYSKRKR